MQRVAAEKEGRGGARSRTCAMINNTPVRESAILVMESLFFGPTALSDETYPLLNFLDAAGLVFDSIKA